MRLASHVLCLLFVVREHSVELFAKPRAATRAEAVAIALRKRLLKI